MRGRDLLIYFAVTSKGDWEDIYERLLKREEVNDEVAKEVLSKIKCKAVTIIDPEYPLQLKNIFKPPFVLFYYGDLTLTKDYKNLLAVVGARKCTAYGKQVTEKLVAESIDKCTIVSGMAYGIDSIAHRAAINNGGKTIAVLGSGIDFCYPMENLWLYEKIKENHLILSEYPANCAPNSENFPVRNRIIAGLCSGVLLPEAFPLSGSQITLHLALKEGKSIMCVPHEITRETINNTFIKEGAFLVQSGDDVKYYMDLN